MTPEEQKGFFEEQGYLIVEDLLTSEMVEQCRKEIERLHHVAADLDPESEPASGNFQREPYTDGVSREDGLPVLRKVENTRKHSTVLRDLSTHPKLIAVVQNLIGEDLLLFRSTLMLKPAFHGSAHGLHQDSAYWPMEPPKLVTVSIALNDATPKNGCIKIIPGSHKWGLQKWGHIVRDKHETMTDRQDVDVSGQINAPLSAGSAVCFHSLMVHGSGANMSPNPRNTALYAYFSPEVRYVPQGARPQEKSFPVVAGLDGRKELTLVAE